MFLTLNAFISMTFREAIRNKILYGIGFFAIAIFLFSLHASGLALFYFSSKLTAQLFIKAAL